MIKTNLNKNGVIGVVSLAQEINPEIGSYIDHFVTENIGFSVRLTDNGAIKIPLEIAQEFEAQPSNITAERILKIVNTYRKN